MNATAMALTIDQSLNERIFGTVRQGVYHCSGPQLTNLGNFLKSGHTGN